MAQFRAEFEETTPVINVYEFDETLFQQFRYKRFEEYSEEWAHFVYMPLAKLVQIYKKYTYLG